MNPKRVFWIAGIAGFVYIGVGWWVINNFELPPLSGAVAVLVVSAGVCQIGAKFFFGLLFS